MKDIIVIRNFQSNDLDACRDLWRELVDWHRVLYDDYTIGGEYPRDHFEKHLSRVGKERIWVAFSDSKMVGLMGLIVKEDEAEIEPLIISQEYRQKGIGTKLIDTAIAVTRSLGLTSLSVRPVLRNLDALLFFYRRGFKTLGQIELFMSLSKKEFKNNIDLFNISFNY